MPLLYNVHRDRSSKGHQSRTANRLVTTGLGVTRILFEMKILPVLFACFALLQAPLGLAATGKAPPKHTSTLGTARTVVPAKLKSGEYLWVPEVSPRGPI